MYQTKKDVESECFVIPIILKKPDLFNWYQQWQEKNKNDESKLYHQQRYLWEKTDPTLF